MISRMKRLIPYIVAILFGIISLADPFYALDAFCTDKAYTKLNGVDNNIILIGVDEETLDEYGNFNLWSRAKMAELIDYLYSDEENSPIVVGVDCMFIDPIDAQGDHALAQAASKGNVITASNIVYRGTVVTDENGKKYYDEMHIADIENPYDELMTSSKVGFSNACIASDGYVRYAMNSVQYVDDNGVSSDYDSFAYALYKEYAAAKGEAVVTPKTSDNGQFRFFYSGESREFSHVSFARVLDGTVPREAFKDAIVLVGAYAPGFMDSYQPAIDRGNTMYGVEIHANIIQAYMQGKTAVRVNMWLFALIMIVIAAAFTVLGKKQRLIFTLIESALIAVLYTLIGRLVAGKGIWIPLCYLYLYLILADIYFVIEKYVIERIRRRKTLDVFKKYVAPQVVDELSKAGDFNVVLGGQKREVAVLFVDIRGFTPLSESLQPEQVVSILNEYLAHTTDCIFRHNGTLDKFVGDATMAVFNAPFDLDDYLYEAVATAWDIKQGSKELGERLYEKFGKKVGFGIGVNCGEAVVGNIGCDFRMDYTAIGDTVNTAARLESNAKAEEILISEKVYLQLKNRIDAEEVGEIPLKGKSDKINVYRVTGMRD